MKTVFLENHLFERRLNTESWFPRYAKYKDSNLTAALDGKPALNPAQENAESRIAADYKRIILAMSHESRRRIGFFVSSLLGLRGNQSAEDLEDTLAERKTHNAFKISQLEVRIEELKGRLAVHAMEEATPDVPAGVATKTASLVADDEDGIDDDSSDDGD